MNLQGILFRLREIGKSWLQLAFWLTVCRVLFYAFNALMFPEAGIMAFVHGIRFDLVVVAWLLLPLTLLWMLPAQWIETKTWKQANALLYLLPLLIVLLSNFVDFEFFKFTNKRATAEIFQLLFLGNFMKDLAAEFTAGYWYFILLFTATTWLAMFIYKKWLNTKVKPYKAIAGPLVLSAIVFACFFTAARGGWQHKPIHIMNAANAGNAKNAALTLSTTFTLLKTFQNRSLPERDYFTDEELNTIYSPVKKISPDAAPNRKNVVIIILESVSNRFIGKLGAEVSYTPFLDSLMERSLVFTRAFANGKRSIEVLPSVFSGIPSLMDEALVTSLYAGNRFPGLPGVLKKHGYSTSFYHGGVTGTMGFDSYCSKIGIEHYRGLEQYPDEEHFDGNWGIWDDKFLAFYAKELKRLKQPFFSSVFTLSSHHPYGVPDWFDYTPRQKNELPIAKSIYYCDQSLESFFSAISNEPFYKNTLFVITADHTPVVKSKFHNNPLGRYRVPLLFYDPQVDSLRKDHKVAQHIDIPLSVLHYLGIGGTHFSFGNNLFDAASPRFNINFLNGYYQLIRDDKLLHFDSEHALGFYNYNLDPMLLNNRVNQASPEMKEMVRLTKAIVQSYNNRLINNTLVP